MTTPPKVTQAEVDRSIALISKRRLTCGDRHIELLPDDAYGVLRYLERHSGPDIARPVRQVEALDVLRLTNWLWWEQRRLELWGLKQGLALNQYLSTLGAQLGIRSRQGTRDRIDRLEALLRFDRPDEQLIREMRRLDLLDGVAQEVEGGWIEEHADELRELTARLLDAADRYKLLDKGQREMLDELASDARLWSTRHGFTPQSMTILGFAADEVAACPGVLALDSSRPHRVHQVLAQAHLLRAQFADLGARTSVT